MVVEMLDEQIKNSVFNTEFFYMWIYSTGVTAESLN